MKLTNYFNFLYSKMSNSDSNIRSHFRFLKYKLFCKHIHVVDEIIFEKNANIQTVNGEVAVGDYLRLKEGSVILAISGNIEIGNCVFINRNCNIACRDHIRIEDSVSIGPNVTIWDHDHKFDPIKVYGMEYKSGEIIIGKGCWIGAGAIILRNTRIGEGSVIGAGTVVKGDIPPHSLVTMDRELIIRPIISKCD